MYEEISKRKPVKGYRNFIAVILLVYGILALMFCVGYVQQTNHIGYLQYILIAGLAVLGIVIVRSLVTEYVYIIAQDRVQIIRKTGEKPKILIEFPIRDIIKCGRLPEVSGEMIGRKKIKAVIGKAGAEAYAIILPAAAVVLNPTGVFTQKLEEVYEKAYR